jgi:hypothetical protein
MVAAVKAEEPSESKFAKALTTLNALSREEGISMAIVRGLAAIHHGYQRFTKGVDVVVQSGNLDVVTRVAPQYGIKVIWKDSDGWHKLQCEGVPIDVVPEGRKPRKDAPAPIPSPRQLGVREGAGYAGIAGWMETKLGSYRVQDRADVVQVIKVIAPATLRKIRWRLGKAHAIYLRRFDELVEAAKEEMQQERQRGGGGPRQAGKKGRGRWRLSHGDQKRKSSPRLSPCAQKSLRLKGTVGYAGPINVPPPKTAL